MGPRSSRKFLESALLQHGGILFRGFDVDSRERFAQFLEAISLPLMRYSNGSRIEDEVVEEIREAYRAETVVFGWQKGDVILLDNMLVAHGRSPYVGERKILTAMGEAHTGAKV